MTGLTDSEITELRRLESAATPGPWRWDGPMLVAAERDVVLWPANALHDPENDRQALGACGKRAEADATANAGLIAASRTAVPKLLDEVERVRALENHAHDLAHAIQRLRNWPGLKKHMRLRGSQEFSDLVSAWDAYVDDGGDRLDAAALARHTARHTARTESRMGEPKWVARARETVATSGPIRVGSTVHLLEMAVADHDALTADLAAARLERDGWKERREETARQLDAMAQEAMATLNKLDAVVHALGIEDSFEDPAEEVRDLISRANEAERRLAEMAAVLGRFRYAIAAALAAERERERERCAKIAEDETTFRVIHNHPDITRHSPWDAGATVAQQVIATAIRQGVPDAT